MDIERKLRKWLLLLCFAGFLSSCDNSYVKTIDEGSNWELMKFAGDGGIVANAFEVGPRESMLQIQGYWSIEELEKFIDLAVESEVEHLFIMRDPSIDEGVTPKDFYDFQRLKNRLSAVHSGLC